MSSYDHLIDENGDSISREIFVNDRIYASELEKIFARAWLLVGHEVTGQKHWRLLCLSHG